jgi:hypothetical protein
MFIMGPKLTQPEPGPWANDDFADREVFRMDGTPVAAPKRVDIAVQDQFQWTPAATWKKVRNVRNPCVCLPSGNLT